MTQNRSKAALFRNNMGAVKGWIVEGYGLEAISEKLRDEYHVELSVEALRTYIRREFKCGPRELREKFSHEKNITNELSANTLKTNMAVGGGQDSGGVNNTESSDMKTTEADLNTLLDERSRNSAVNSFFGRKPK